MDGGTAVVVRDLQKRYGSFEALRGISFEVREGEVFGLMGPNGAGKTTTLRILATLLRITSGFVEILGVNLAERPAEVRKRISYLPEDAGAFKTLTGRAYQRFIAEFFTDRDDADAMVARGVEIARLGRRIDAKVETYSKGMARRLLVARALMTRPRVAILDELGSGLDALNAEEIRRIVRDAARSGMTIILSSPNTLEGESMCDRIALFRDGRIGETGTPAELKAKQAAANAEEVLTTAVA